MTKWWDPSFDPMEELIHSRNRIHQLEANERALINAQNDLGSAVKQLVEQHNEVLFVLGNHKREIEQLKHLIDPRNK